MSQTTRFSPVNTLYYGDNRDILPRYVKDESVDLIYLDPPFKSNQDYNVLFAEPSGVKSAAQIMVFEDTWHWNEEAEKWYEHVVSRNDKVSDLLVAFRDFLGDNDMMAYLANMAPCLVELRRVLKPTGSIYLHCDPTASHYLKLLMDAVFGAKNFRNEVVWHYKRWPAKQKNFQRMHDIILFYSAVPRNTVFNIVFEELSEGTQKRWRGKKSKVEFAGKIRLVTQMTDEESLGRPADDVWDIPVINSQAGERLGYPTQKPEALLERIIKASSNECDVVLDPFCGCGTAIAVAQKLNRKWLGIDITHLAITLIKQRLRTAFGEGIDDTYDVKEEPVDLEGARYLAEHNKYQFQWWALDLVGARPEEQKKGADHGIDGRRYFIDGKDRHTEKIIISVKGGKVGVKDVRDLRGVIDREKAAIGILITLEKPTGPMKIEAASAKFYHSLWRDQKHKHVEELETKHPRLQILTIEELLSGKQPDLPVLARTPNLDKTFKKAPKAKKGHKGNSELDLE